MFENANESAIYQDSHLAVDFEEREVWLDGNLLQLTPKDFDLLAFLIRHEGRTLSRLTLFTLVWRYGMDVRTRTLDAHIAHLRRHLGSHGREYIRTVCKIGYRFQSHPVRPRFELPVMAEG